MKKILIISPHFPPSSLAAVHRSRLFAMHLPTYGWLPIVLTIHEKYYEEALDRNLEKILPAELRIEKVKAMRVSRPRLVGDIGIRGFFQLYRKAKYLINKEEIDFLFIPIPSFYVALLGRWLHNSTGIRYGIDYIDPWVHHFAGSEKKFSRHWFSTKLSSFLEPVAIKKASLITGVAEGYYQGVKERNPHLLKQAIFASMPYGGEKRDHNELKEMMLQPYLFKKKAGKIQLLYAGAMLPKAYQPLEAILSAIKEQKESFNNLEIHFIGTGKSPNDNCSFNIRPLAEKYGLWQDVIFEYPARIPYLDVLIHLEAAGGVFILGSTEPHYTPSKVYQGVLSQKPILAVLHSASTAVKVIEDSKAGIVLTFSGENGMGELKEGFTASMKTYLAFLTNFQPDEVLLEIFDQYSAKKVTEQLAKALDLSVSSAENIS